MSDDIFFFIFKIKVEETDDGLSNTGSKVIKYLFTRPVLPFVSPFSATRWVFTDTA